MSYKRQPEIIRSDRTRWSKEHGGRTKQKVGGKEVAKFSFSPYTAKPYIEYTFYADIVLKVPITSPPNSETKIENVTLMAWSGTFIAFRRAVMMGEVTARLEDWVTEHGGEAITSLTYWRNKGNRTQSNGTLIEGGES